MKKSLVAVGIIVALGVIWSGSAWYTGKQLESRMDDILAEANDQIDRAAPHSGLVLSYQHYYRGWFSSKLKLVVAPKPDVTNGWLKPGESVVFNQRVDHGPFPLMSLKDFNLLPALGEISTVLENTPVSAKLFTDAHGKSPFTLKTRIAYSGATRSDLSLNPLSIDYSQGKIALGKGRINIDADSKQQGITYSGKLDSALYSSINEYGQRVQLTSGDLTLDGDTTLSSFAERVGKQSLNASKLAIAVEGKELALIEGLKIVGNSDIEKDGKHMSGQLDYSLDALKLQNRNLGSGNLHLTVNQLDGDAVHQFSQAIGQQQQAIMNDPAMARNPQLRQQKIVDAVKANLPLLLKGNPVINVAPLSWKNDKGEATFNLTLGLKEPSSQPVTADNLQAGLDNVLNNLDAKLTIPLDVATAFMAQVAQLEGYQKDDAQKLAEQQVKGVSAMGQMFQITTEKDDAIAAQLKYANGQVTVNDRTMSLNDFISKYTFPTGIIPDAPAPTLPQE